MNNNEITGEHAWEPASPHEDEAAGLPHGWGSEREQARLPLSKLVNSVFVADYKLAPILSMADSAASALRRKIWQNENRNQAVVDLARAIVEGNAEQLHAFHVGAGKLPEELSGVRWLAILVGNKEHALAIHRLLPTAVLEYAAARELVHNASMAMPQLTITTVMAAHLGRQFMPDVVINATGGPHMLDLRRLVPADVWGCHRAAIVELADEHSQDAVEATRKRLQRYAFQRVRLFDSGNRMGFDLSKIMFATGANRGPSSTADSPASSSRSKGRGQRKSRRQRTR